MSIFRVLHLSDLHIGNTFLPTQELACKIADDIAQNGLKGIRCVLVTGDIFNGPSGFTKKLVDEAAEFFRTLKQELELDQAGQELSLDDFIFVPGNHDLVWSEDAAAQWEKYRSFLECFYGTIPAHYNRQDFSVLRKYPGDHMVFLGFNSCGLEKRRPYNEGYDFCKRVSEASFESAGIDKNSLLTFLEHENGETYEDFGEIPIRQLSSQRRQLGSLADLTSVALFHHHFYLFPDIAGKVGDADVVRNHPTLVRELHTMGVKTVLHGHKHFDLERPFINEDYYETTDSIINVFAGGSAGAEGLQQHTFSVIDFYPRQESVKLTQRKFVYRGDHLEPLKIKQIPPQNKAAQLIRLLDLLKDRNYAVHQDYLAASMTNQRLFNICNCVINWLDEALTGFPEVCRLFSDDLLCLQFLLFSVYSRTLAGLRRHSRDEAGKYETTAETFLKLYGTYLKPHIHGGYLGLFQAVKLQDAAALCDGMLDQSASRKEKQYLAFTMVGIFFSDMYLVMTEYADEFYNQISQKVNIRLQPNQFHNHVPAARIKLTSDADRRSAYVNLWCRDATAHKLAVLFVKEFDLAISKFEDYFKLIGLKLYYLLPKIEKDPSLDALDNYNFEAYIPTLLPLLTGDNIYDSKEVFARELIQNSIDAISVRKAVEGHLDGKDQVIHIDLGTMEKDKKYFQITDHGTGMDRYKIERYFTSIGRSFYSGEDYTELGIGYKPISSFGIGFLSSFMVCREIDVQTRSFQDERERLRLHIPNYEGCFFIERDQNAVTGTKIRLNLTPVTNSKKIIAYIKEVMLDIQYPIRIMKEGRKTPITIPAHSIRAQAKKELFRFMIPFHEDGHMAQLDWKNDILGKEAFNEYPYGLMIFPSLKKFDESYLLNSGIFVGGSDLDDLFLAEKTSQFQSSWRYFRHSSKRFCLTIIMNFPSNWIQMDVSREKIVGFSNWMEKQYDGNALVQIRKQIVQILQKQLNDFITYAKSNEAPVCEKAVEDLLLYISWMSKDHLPDIKDWCEANQCSATVTMEEDKITYRLMRGTGTNLIDPLNFSSKYSKMFINLFRKIVFQPLKEELGRENNTNPLELSNTNSLELSDLFRGYHPSSLGSIRRADSIADEYKLLWISSQLLFLYLTNKHYQMGKRSMDRKIISLLSDELSTRFSVSEVESQNAVISVSYDEILDYFKRNLEQPKKI